MVERMLPEVLASVDVFRHRVTKDYKVVVTRRGQRAVEFIDPQAMSNAHKYICAQLAGAEPPVSPPASPPPLQAARATSTSGCFRVAAVALQAVGVMLTVSVGYRLLFDDVA